MLLEFGKYEVWVFSNLINTISQYCFFVWREANMAKINQEPSRHSARLCFNSWILHHIAHTLCFFFRQFDNPFKCNFISFSLTFPHSMLVGFGHLHLPGQGGALSITKIFPVTSGPEFRQIFCKSLEVSALLEEREKSNERIMV